MNEYCKINSIYKRTPKGQMVLGDYSENAFALLEPCQWTFTEKVDGTNIRVGWDGQRIAFGGRSDAAQIPAFLVDRLRTLFLDDSVATAWFREHFPQGNVTLYGEGYGAKIQKGGGHYKPDGVDFVLFDVLAGDLWLERHNVIDVAEKLGVRPVPIIGHGTLADMVKIARRGFDSTWGPFTAEGIVARPVVELRLRNGDRIITKIKHKDFNNLADVA